MQERSLRSPPIELKFESLLNVQVNAFNNNPDDQKRTIVINNLGVRTTDFDLFQELKCKLVQQRAIAACKYFGGQAVGGE